MKIYNIINIPKGLSQEIECDCREEYNSGYTEGLEEGFDKGYDSGYTDGAESVDCKDFYDSGVTDGYASGYTSGRTDGYDDGWQPGYDSGRTDGEKTGYDTGYEEGKEYQKTLLVSTAITTNGTYEREDGFNQVVVNVPSMSGAGYTSGYTDGYASGYTDGSEDGYDSGYTSGHTDGISEQKSKLVSTAITQNGTYSREDGGFSQVEVNVPTGQTINNQEKWVQFGPSPGDYKLTWIPNLQAYATNMPVSVSADTGYTGIEPAIIDIYRPATEAIALGEQNQRAKLVTTAFTTNGTYSREDGWNNVTINVPQTGHTDQEMQDNWNSGYTSGKTDGYDEGYNSGYTSGVTDGGNAQKAKLTFTAFAANGTYTRPDGWSAVTVNVPQTGHTDEEMQQAYASGQTYQKSLLVSTAVTENGTYSRPDGYSSIQVSIPQTGHTDQEMAEAYDSGITHQKSLLAATAFTNNGTYTRADGWSAVTVNVSGYTQQDLDNAFNSGWTNGYNSGNTDGYNSGWTDGYISGYTDGSGQTPSTAATALTISVPSSITGTGKVNVTAEPSTAVLDLVYTSSDNTIATVNSNGNITVLSAGTITITVTDRNSGLFDTQTITVEPYSGLNIPFTVDVISAGTILWVANASATPLTIQYQKNNGEWTSITSSTAGTQISLIEGDVVRFRGDNLTYSPNNTSPDIIPKYNNHFLMQTGKYALKGNIMSLINSTNFANLTTLSSSCTFYGLFNTSNGLVDASQLLLPATNLSYYCYQNMFGGCSYLEAAPAILPATILSAACYYDMFSGCTSLTTAPKLPATTLAGECYSHMFYGCTSLTTAPELPATTLAYECYEEMFSGCISLTVVPDLSATTLANKCCDRMFQGCSSLTTAPSLPATTLANNCYEQMFYGCTSLTTAPALPATTLANYCYYQMFYGCRSLTTAPELPATALAQSCYNSMFYNCTSLTTAPDLQAAIVPANGYSQMFYGCTNLSSIKCLAIDKSATNCTFNWVTNVASTGTFVKDPNISESTWKRGVNGIPTGWTIVDAS